MFCRVENLSHPPLINLPQVMGVSAFCGRPPYSAIRDRDGNLLTYITENALDEDHPYYPYWPDHQAREFGVIETEDGVELQYQLTLPKDFDPARQYPAIVYLYGGPGGAEVKKTWSVDFNQILAQNGFVVFTVDNRGTGNRGTAFDAVIYRNMGGYEVRDQVTGARWLMQKPFVDAARIGIHGWSYGGYLTLLCMFKAPDIFKAGIAVAPVVDWRLYDTHYTERYMGDPADGDFYDRSDQAGNPLIALTDFLGPPLNRKENQPSEQFFLILHFLSFDHFII